MNVHLLTRHCWVFIGLLFVGSFAAMAQDEPTTNWPKEIVTKKGKVVVYQPQTESLKGDILESRAAVSIHWEGRDIPVFGAIWLTSYMDIDKSNRLVRLKSVDVNNVRLPDDIEPDVVEKFRVFLEEEMIKWHFEMNYDDLLATLEEVDIHENYGFDNSPPKIIFRESAAILMVLDGEPKFKELEKKYEQVVNCPGFLLKKKKNYYLYGGNMWFKTKELYGEWKHLKNPPTNLKTIERKYNRSNQDPLTEKPKETPEIIIVTEPTELIVTGGELKFTPIEGTQLLYVDNTESDLFMDIETQNYYILLSGRWFIAKGLQGPWQNVKAEDISQEFKKIPEESVKGEVLASVPGTQMAREAVLDANIPQTAAIERTATAQVTYDGEPQFKIVEGTKLQYAVNTSSSVFKAGDVYYLCDNAVWFSSTSANGPWKVSDVRPVDVEKIPASNPNYNVKYVYIYDSTPDVVYVGYTPGYVGCYVYGPTVVYGTGFYYRGWYGYHYYPRPVTYGFSVRYSPYFGWSIGVSIGFGGPGYWYHGRGYWGPPMYRPPYYRPPYHHRPPGYRPPGYRPPGYRPPSTGRPGQLPSTQPVRPTTRPATANIYDNKRDRVRPSTRPSTGQTRPSQPSTRPANSDRYRPSDRSNQTRPATRPSTSDRSRPNNNVYTDRSGNVYRKSNNGWESRQNNQWSQPSQQPNRSTNQQLDRSYQNRQRGTQRTQNYNRSRGAVGGRGRR